MIDHLVLTIPMRTVSEANQREHWTKRNRRKRNHQAEVLYEWRVKAGTHRFKLPCCVTFTRYAVQMLDSDNLAGAFKAARDMIASLLGVDDSPTAPVEWVYRQEKIKKREHRVMIEVRSV